MIARSNKLIYDLAVALFLLVVFAGCAQTRANIKEPDAAVNVETAVIQAINISSDASQIEVQTDKPLSYTYYKTDDPPKVVIDLAQTDPGSVTKLMEVNAGNIKSIEVAKHDFTGGFLSRIEVMLAKGEEFTVATDSVDKGKLLIKFATPVVDEKRVAEAKEETKPAPVVTPEVKPIAAQQQADTQAIKVDEKPAPAVEPSVKPETQQPQTEIKEEKKDAQPTPVIASNVAKEEKQVASETNKDVVTTAVTNPNPPIQAKVLRAITANDDGIEINVPGGVDSFNAFKLTKPDRVVLDLPGVKSGMVGKSVAINKFTVGQARLGIYPDKVRIVFDAAKDSLPAYQVIKSSDGLKVLFVKAPVSENAANISNEPVNEPAQPAIVEKKAVAPKTSAIEAIDFKIVDDYSQIAIKINGDCNPGKVVKVAGGLSLTINNCQVPTKFQRMIDTGAFPGVVKKITPYQVKVKKGNNARILVKLRQATSFSLKQEGNTVYWNIQNPEANETPAVASKMSKKTTEVAIAAPAQEEKAAKGGETELSQEKKQDAQLIGGEKKVYTGRRVSLEFSDADIRKILQLIAEVSNLNFLIGDDVSGTISVKLVNVPWDQALDVILETKGLEKKQDGNIMYIKPKGKFKTENQEEAEAQLERERSMQLKTKVFDINFAAVGDIAGQFDKLKSERGTIAQDSRTNRVIVTDVEDRLKKMSALLKELDMPEKQVMIEARIVQASNTFARDIGVQWGLHYRDTGGNGSFLGITSTDVGMGGIVTSAPTVGSLLASGGSAAGITFGKLANDIQVDLKLSAAASLELIKIISTPKILTLNNKAGKITQGQNIPYQTVSAEGTKTEFIEASLTLEVTPHIAADGSVSMKIKATNNSAGSGSPPPINTQEATTEVLVNNGETIVIGGIYSDSDNDLNQGVPYLQDIPVLGWLFKSNSKLKKKTELLIFITPKIVN
jgi:type IV pilus assembly protein PilQ